MREWEDETPQKKPATEENHQRMGDLHHRRPSTPPRGDFRRSSSEARRAEELRRANENYHPSEAAHHPPSHGAPQQLPPMQSVNTPVRENLPPPPAPPAAPVEHKQEDKQEDRRSPRPFGSMHHQALPPAVQERKRSPSQSHAPPLPQSTSSGEPERAERAARKMDVDENYDESGDEKEKPAPAAAATAGSPTRPGQPKIESPQ